MKLLTTGILISAVTLLTACSSAPKNVPVKVYTEPAGGYVIYRVDSGNESAPPWIYLGTTPLETTVALDKSAKKAGKFSIRIMKEGYFDSNKDWEPEKLQKELKERSMIFWNPGLVEHNPTRVVPYSK